MTVSRTQTYSTRLRDEDVERLVARAADGDQLAWNTLIDRFGGVVWAMARAHRLSEADAADVVQCTWMRLVEHLDRIRDPACLSAWLATTARRECLRVIKHATRTIPCGDDLPGTPIDDSHPGERLTGRQRDVALNAALGRLELRDRVLLRLLCCEPSLTYQEISATLAIPVGSIGPTRARALDRLRSEVMRAGLISELTIGASQ